MASIKNRVPWAPYGRRFKTSVSHNTWADMSTAFLFYTLMYLYILLSNSS